MFLVLLAMVGFGFALTAMAMWGERVAAAAR